MKTQLPFVKKLLGAVTISAGYSKNLSASFASSQAISEWVILTVPDDVETRRAVASLDDSSVFVHECDFEGAGFHAAYNKGRYLNVGLRELRRRGGAGVGGFVGCGYFVAGGFWGAAGGAVAFAG